MIAGGVDDDVLWRTAREHVKRTPICCTISLNRKRILRLVFSFDLPTFIQDRQAEGSLLSSKQTRTEDSTQSENTAQSLNSHTWHNSSGTWTSPQDNSHRTDEYGFPIRSEAPINAREFPSLAASKQAPAGKKTSQQDQV